MSYLVSVRKEFLRYKSLGDKAMAQVPDEGLHWQYNEESNSIATTVKHIWGNMLSRWTSFLTEDGEKEWRQRDREFEEDKATRAEVLGRWDEGWACLFAALDGLKEEDLQQTVYIRAEAHTVMEAINRQLAHYPYHVGQIVYLARMQAGGKWTSLSIARNKSDEFNREKFRRK
ncbi:MULTISPECIES: DUF1572 family protein [unclassified Imperialibacter]|uniref:DUF1572 family protein n=1 Tax=unclassified Imperialibacter TaxID=2629706 RepID=UPI001258AE72|nr:MULTISPECIES: DUF1572 family protein [unclassified Imperialibacter]CAD5258755.1 conserved hypothetical protein [Imperialibacter sp. 89]CAD5265702.1 conserved hypothetical protein [Imperialibacter sp. 75]VVT21472.1 conserved hypothetical protein [Imperialibacter sp. EC-SDR9]